MVDEDLVNYMEIQNWIRGLGFPESLNEFTDLKNYMELQNLIRGLGYPETLK